MHLNVRAEDDIRSKGDIVDADEFNEIFDVVHNGIDVVGGEVDVDEDRHGTELKDRIDGRRKTRGHSDHFVTGAQGALAEQMRRQRGHGQQIGGGAGVSGEQMSPTEVLAEPSLKGIIEAAGCQPPV